MFRSLCSLGLITAFVLGAVALPTANLPADDIVPGWRQADRHNPFSPRYVNFQPRGGITRIGVGTWGVTGGGFGGWGFGNSLVVGPGYSTWGWPGWNAGGLWGPNYQLSYGFNVPVVAAPWGGVPFGGPVFGGGWGAPWGQPVWFPNGGCFWRGPVVLPPIVLPAEQLYGLGPVLRMTGVLNPPAPLVGGIDQAPPAVDAAAVEPPRPKIRKSNATARERAWKFMGFGDAHFQKLAFRAAYERYVNAISSAPDVVDGHLRKAQTLVAMNNYPMAFEAFKKALKLHPDWANAGFTLVDLYGADNAFTQKAHREALEQAFADNPGDAALPFLIAMQYLFDGQKDRALEFLDQAKRLAGEDLAGENFAAGGLPDPPLPAAGDAPAAAPPRPMPPPDVD